MPTTAPKGPGAISGSDQSAMFSSRAGFLLAAIGFAVGLGNIWRFPYLTGENGGGAFVLVYLLCVIAIGVPILMAELLIGRRGRGSPPAALAAVASAEQASSRWRMLGSMNVLAAFLIMIVYAVIAGWVLRYLYVALLHGFAGVTAASAQASFAGMQADTVAALGWTLLPLALAGAVVFAGVQAGIERAVRVLMPLLFVLLVGLALYNVFAGGFMAAVRYLFVPDFSQISGAMVLTAIGQAFFSMGVAMAGMMTFGAYLPAQVSIGRSAIIIALGDTLVALVAGLVIFPVVFNNALDPASGTGLIFQTLPVAFAQMPGGYLIGVLFFLLLAVAAITSIVGFLEPMIVWLGERAGFSRVVGTPLTLVAIAMLASVSALSFGPWSDVSVAGMSLADFMDFVPNQLLLPCGGLLIAVFAGWIMSEAASASELGQELGLEVGLGYRLWRVLARYVVPLGVGVILATGLF